MSNHPEKFDIDRWMIRAKDIIIICGAMYGLFIFGTKYIRIPGIQEAQAGQIANITARTTVNEREIAILKSGINDIKDLIINRRA